MKPETQATRLPLPLAGSLLLCVFALPTLHAAESANRIYKCTDAKGKVYVTQTPPPECLGRPTDVLNKRGTVVQRDEGILTPQQQAQREAEQKKKLEMEAAAKEDRRRATALLNTYSSEKDVEDARARALKENENAIAQTDKKIADVLRRKKVLESEKEFYAKSKPPAKLQQDIQNNEIELKNQQELLDAIKKQVATINAKYDDDKKRYIELTKNLPKR